MAMAQHTAWIVERSTPSRSALTTRASGTAGVEQERGFAPTAAHRDSGKTMLGQAGRRSWSLLELWSAAVPAANDPRGALSPSAELIDVVDEFRDHTSSTGSSAMGRPRRRQRPVERRGDVS